MGIADKISNKMQGMRGRAKEATGKATDDRSLQAEGVVDEAKSNVKQAGEKVKDAARDVKEGTER